MSKLVVVHTISKVRHAYVVRLDNDANPEDLTKQILEDSIEEMYQTHCSETFETSYEINEDDAIKLYDNNHAFDKGMLREKKLEYIADYRTVKDHE